MEKVSMSQAASLEKTMEPRPVSVSDTATGEDDFGHVAR